MRVRASGSGTPAGPRSTQHSLGRSTVHTALGIWKHAHMLAHLIRAFRNPKSVNMGLAFIGSIQPIKHPQGRGFPTPLGPSRPVICPSSARKLTSETADLDPKALLRFEATIIGSVHSHPEKRRVAAGEARSPPWATVRGFEKMPGNLRAAACHQGSMGHPWKNQG